MSKHTLRSDKGFSLIELLIVVAIILIVAAIAIPNLLRSKMAADESSAVQSLRTMNTTEILYSTTYNTLSPDLASLGPDAANGTTPTAAGADLVDSVMAGGIAGAAPVAGATTILSKSGYTITYAPNSTTPPVSSYTITAVPNTVNVTGIRSFYTDQTGVIHTNALGSAPSVTDPPL
jgi:type IV pilus assembly protein PilA